MNQLRPASFMNICCGLFLWSLTLTATGQNVEKEQVKSTVMIPVEDTISLSTDIYLPEGEDPFACILIRTPYDKRHLDGQAKMFTGHGYAVVTQDTRGKFESQGQFYPFIYERRDGLATLKWIRSQSWNNGMVAGWGGSYVGYTQWAIADQLDAITPVLTSANMFELFYPSGILSLATLMNWALAVDSKTQNDIDPDKLAASYSILPLSLADDSTFRQVDFFEESIDQSCEKGIWRSTSHRSAETCPVFSVAGWYDIFLMAQLRDFTGLSPYRPSESRMVIGPYAHGQSLIEMGFGENAKLDLHYEGMLSFLSSILEGKTDAASDRSHDQAYTLFIINRNEWYEASQWPPENAPPVTYFFNTNGQISTKQSADDKVAEYLYDPADPFGSIGGTYLGRGAGPAYQNPNTERKDQIVFESAPLDQELVLLGPVDATLYVRTDVPCTDFFVSLQEVRPDGKIINIQEGGKTIYNDELSDPRVQQVDISLWATGYQINRGHKMRAVISSSLFPRYNRNLNSGEPISLAREPRCAHQKIYYGRNFPSGLILSVLDMKTQ